MNLGMIGYIVACVLEIEAALMLLPAFIGLCYMERSAWSFAICALLTVAVCAPRIIKKPKNTAIYAKEGFVATALSWLAMSAVGAAPFCMTGQIPHYVDALFEMVSGFTTTGASILPVVENLDHCMLFWRSFSHWIGGMGVLVFMLAILPMAGGQNLHLMRAESPGPSVGKLVPRLKTTAMWLYGIYLGLSIACFLLLWVGGMNAFDASCLTFGAAGTGGFGTVSSSFAGHNLFCKTVTTIFMLLFGMNFNFFYLLILKKFKDALKMEEIWGYLIIYFFAVGTILLSLWHHGLLGGEAHVIDAFFSVSSVMTTTGYATADFNQWPTYCRIILVMIMFTGACAGSTGGGIKISRWLIYKKAVSNELRRLTHPRSIRHIRMDGKVLDDSVVRNTFVYLALFIVIYAVSLLVVSLDGQDVTTSFTAVAATINNIGPGLNAVGPVGNYTCFSIPSKLVLIFDMLAGRLEIFPLMIFFLPSTWRRHN